MKAPVATVPATLALLALLCCVGSAPLPRTLSPALAYRGGSTGCVLRDPSGTGGCVTGTLSWLMGQVRPRFGALPVGCWDRHAWNPRSDHPRGKACDYTIGRIGRFPAPALVAKGWSLAIWLRRNSVALRVHYVIYQGRIWSREHDAEGWRPYLGGGVYDPRNVTGGHFDHVHVSVFN